MGKSNNASNKILIKCNLLVEHKAFQDRPSIIILYEKVFTEEQKCIIVKTKTFSVSFRI